MERKAQLSLPVHLIIFFLVGFVVLVFALVIAKDVVITKEYIANETRADTNLYVFLNDQTCTGIGVTNAEIISIGLAHAIEADEDIEIEYNEQTENDTSVSDCLISFFKRIDYQYKSTILGSPQYYFAVKKGSSIEMELGNPKTKGNTETAQITTSDGNFAEATLTLKRD